MLRLCCVLLLASTLAVDAGAQNNAATGDAFHSEQARIRQRGTDALEHERSRSKADPCEHAGNGERGGAGIADCLMGEITTTDQNYRTYVRSIGALLRNDVPGGLNDKTSKRLTFDDAETTWLKYRDQACTSMATQWADVQSSIANVDCRLRLTRNHMNELDSMYSSLALAEEPVVR
jgi:uncharacterized protein YecT (DUF1311 family)